MKISTQNSFRITAVHCAGVLGRKSRNYGKTPLSRDITGQNELKSFEKEKTKFPVLEHHFPISNILFCFRTSFSCFKMPFSALSHFVPHPVPVLGKIFSSSCCPFVSETMMELLSLCPKKLHCTVPSRWKP